MDRAGPELGGTEPAGSDAALLWNFLVGVNTNALKRPNLTASYTFGSQPGS
jgi:hypothetical protein